MAREASAEDASWSACRARMTRFLCISARVDGAWAAARVFDREAGRVRFLEVADNVIPGLGFGRERHQAALSRWSSA